jgi:hypothetical protein
MDSDIKFWSVVNFLTNNSDVASYIDIQERKKLSDSVSLARRANKLTGIPTESFRFVMLLAETVKERMKRKKKI